MESRLQPLSFHINWTLPELEEKAIEYMVSNTHRFLFYLYNNKFSIQLVKSSTFLFLYKFHHVYKLIGDMSDVILCLPFFPLHFVVKIFPIKKNISIWKHK